MDKGKDHTVKHNSDIEHKRVNRRDKTARRPEENPGSTCVQQGVNGSGPGPARPGSDLRGWAGREAAQAIGRLELTLRQGCGSAAAPARRRRGREWVDTSSRPQRSLTWVSGTTPGVSWPPPTRAGAPHSTPRKDTQLATRHPRCSARPPGASPAVQGETGVPRQPRMS